jgi:two-component system sensor histidine kinase/response regulator
MSDNNIDPSKSRKRVRRLILPFIIVVLVIGGLLLYFLTTMQKRMYDEAMLENARVYSDVLRSTQAFYASQVLSNIDSEKITLTHDVENVENALPFPATLTMNFAEYLSHGGSDFTAAMLSEYPFSWREERVFSGFESRAFLAINLENGDEYFEFDRSNGGEKYLLNYARTIRMEAACVACHNSHPASSKTDWKVGDVRGIHVIKLPVNPLIAGLSLQFTYLIIILSIITFLTAGAITFVRHSETAALQKLEDRNEDLQAANIEKDQANSAKGDFLANISHEIRTPINGILGLADLMILDNPRDEDRERLRRIRSAGSSLLHVINDVLDFSKIEANEMTLEDIPFEIEDVIQSVVGVFVLGRKIEGQPELFVQTDPRLPKRIMGDPHRVSQILMNLLSNAFKFTETGHIVLSIQPHASKAGVIQLAVTDTGSGIHEEVKELLFKPFSQADGTITRRYGGTGLGLAISFDLAKRMGGSLKMETQLGKGSTFTLTFPMKAASIDEPSIIPKPPEKLSHIHIYDTENTRRAIQLDFFTKLGIEVTSISTLLDAKTTLKRIAQDQADIGELLLVNLDGNVAQEMFDFCEGEESQRLIVVYPPSDLTFKAGKHLLQRPLLPTVLMRHISQKLGDLPMPSIEERPTEENALMPLKGLSVLAVDDNDLNSVVIKAFLERGGAKTKIANSGTEAIEMASTERFDVILMDIQMPDMDGYEAARRIRAATDNDVPIIALTAHALKQDKERSLDEGMADHLSKPVTRVELYSVLDRFVPQG